MSQIAYGPENEPESIYELENDYIIILAESFGCDFIVTCF